MTSSTFRPRSSGFMCRRRSPSVMMPASLPPVSVMPTQPKPFADISTIASDMRVPSGASGVSFNPRITSRVYFRSAPSWPAGCSARKSSAVKARLSSSATERAVGGTGHRDQRDAEAARIIDQAAELGRLARPGQRDDHVVRRDHAEIAVARFARMDEEGGRAGRGQRGCDLAADMARFAHAGDDGAAACRTDALDRGDERGPKLAAQGGGQGGDAAGFGVEGAERGFDQRAALRREFAVTRYFWLGHTC